MIRIKLYAYSGDCAPIHSLVNPQAVSFIRPGSAGTAIDEDGQEKSFTEVSLNGMIFYTNPDDTQELIDAVEGYGPNNPRGSEPEILNQTLIADSADQHRSLDTVDKALDTISNVLTAGRTVNGK